MSLNTSDKLNKPTSPEHNTKSRSVLLTNETKQKLAEILTNYFLDIIEKINKIGVITQDEYDRLKQILNDDRLQRYINKKSIDLLALHAEIEHLIRAGKILVLPYDEISDLDESGIAIAQRYTCCAKIIYTIKRHKNGKIEVVETQVEYN